MTKEHREEDLYNKEDVYGVDGIPLDDIISKAVIENYNASNVKVHND
jgi:hypothetical protein